MEGAKKIMGAEKLLADFSSQGPYNIYLCSCTGTVSLTVITGNGNSCGVYLC